MSTFWVHSLPHSILLWKASVQEANDFICPFHLKHLWIHGIRGQMGRKVIQRKTRKCQKHRFLCPLLLCPAWPCVCYISKLLFTVVAVILTIHTCSCTDPCPHFTQVHEQNAARSPTIMGQGNFQMTAFVLDQLFCIRRSEMFSKALVVYNSHFYQFKSPFETLRTLFATFPRKAQRT